MAALHSIKREIMGLIRQTFLEGIDFFYQIYLNRNLLYTLSMRDFHKKYVKNFLGLVWAVIDPLAFVVILYFVFGARYGNKTPETIPFFIYLLTGYTAFIFFNGTVISVTNVIKEHSFLLTKVSFRIAILPIVTVMSNLIIHLIVLGICFITLFFNHIYPSVYWFQLFYYLFALSVLLISIGWLTSSIYLFFPDIMNILNIITRILFFITPIFWKMEGLPPANRFILKFNPVFYPVNGYRESMLFHKPFWDSPALTLYFWSVCLFFLICGVIVFKKLRPHFADVV
jgi:teichoic acid transport system permease protein